MSKTAREYFEERGGLNCAQSVVQAFHDREGCGLEIVEELSAFGGGRAPGGICGALHGAQVLAEDGTHASALADQFKVKAGSMQCREIRRSKQLSCADCVELAETLLKK